MAEKRFEHLLTDEDQMRRSHRVERGRVTWFVAQYEALIAGEWTPIVRYDTAHGYAHMDLYHADGTSEKRRLHTQNYNEAYTFALQDLLRNWQRYRRKFEEELSDEA